MKSSIVKIGRYHYALVPKVLWEKIGSLDFVEVTAKKGLIVVRPVNHKAGKPVNTKTS